MGTAPRSEFGERLEKAIKLEGNPGSIRAFQELLETKFKKRERFGYSYPAINAYLQPSGPVPGMDWVEEVAKLLKVRPAWLAFGEEPMVAVGSMRGVFQPEASGGPVRSAATILPGLTFGAGEDLLVRLVHELANAQPADAPGLTDEDLAQATRVIESAVFGIYNALRGGEGKRSARPGVQAILGILVGMLAAVPEPRAGRPLVDVLELLPQPRDIISSAEKTRQRKARTKGGR